MADIPRILLVGAGKFGRNYIPVLTELHAAKKIDFVGVVVTSAERAATITAEFSVPAFLDYKTHLPTVDAVFVVTPPETHMEIVSRCLEYTDVFVEKPLAYTAAEVVQLESRAVEFGRQLMVGQLFRFHAVTAQLREEMKAFSDKKILGLEGVFVNPVVTDVGRPVSYEMIHWYDLVHFLFPDAKSSSIHAQSLGSPRYEQVSIRYQDFANVELTLGWAGDDRVRDFTIVYEGGDKIVADYITNEVRVTKKGEKIVTNVPVQNALKDEIKIFVAHVKNGEENPVPPRAVLQTVAVAEQVESQLSKVVRPRVAVIGAGIFGTNLAYDIADTADVILFEKCADIMQEGAMVNQFRHHMGYHYPRSSETVLDIQHSNQVFEERFSEALVTTTPTYYGIAKEGSHVTPEQFLAFCDEHHLPYEVEMPPTGSMNEDLMALVIKVPEPSYHYERLKKKVETLLAEKYRQICLRLSTKVIDCELLSDGKKSLTVELSDGTLAIEIFDFVINATYAHMNDFTSWLDVPRHPVRIDLAEVLIVSLPTPLVSLTVMDGPFATIMPTGNPGECTLYHAEASILDRYTPSDGLVKSNVTPVSRADELFERSRVLFPILNHASIIESRIIHRGVLACHEHDDARVADIVSHGFGCWSVLSGKIVSSVRTSKRIAELIAQTQTT